MDCPAYIYRFGFLGIFVAAETETFGLIVFILDYLSRREREELLVEIFAFESLVLCSW